MAHELPHKKLDGQRLYSWYMPAVLALTVLWNSILLIFSINAAGAIYDVDDAASPGITIDWSLKLAMLVLFLCRSIVPVMIWMNSAFELYRYWQGTLRPLRIVIAASSSIVLLLVSVGYWTPCVAPVVRVETEDWKTMNPSSPGSLALHQSSNKYRCYVIPWLVTPAVLLYMTYLFLGVVALHHERKVR